MNASELTVTVVLRRRASWKRLLRLPFLFRRHYMVMRRYEGRIVSAYGAWLMVGLVVDIRRAA